MPYLLIVLSEVVKRVPGRHRPHNDHLTEGLRRLRQQTIRPSAADPVRPDVQILRRGFELLQIERIHLGGSADQVDEDYALRASAGTRMVSGRGLELLEERRSRGPG